MLQDRSERARAIWQRTCVWRHACREKQRVRFTTAAVLVNELVGRLEASLQPFAAAWHGSSASCRMGRAPGDRRALIPSFCIL